MPIPNWRWDRVEGEPAAGGTTWGTYHLVGTYDGASFGVSRAALAPPERRPSHQEQFKHEPERGARNRRAAGRCPTRRSERYLEPATRAARAQPDFAGLWLSYLVPMGTTWRRTRGSSC